MSDERVYHATLDNGLVVVCEEMESVESAALTVLVPAGAANDPADGGGTAGLLSEMVFRGAGRRSSRELTDYLDGLGVQRGESVNTYHTCLSAATLASHLEATLEVYADVLRRPHLPADQLPAVQALAIQQLDSLEDEPRQKVLVELRARHYPWPLGRNALGVRAEIAALSAETIRAEFQRRYVPNGTIVGIAGRVRWDQVRRRVAELLGDWAPGEVSWPAERPAGPAVDHIARDTVQTQIGIAYPSVTAADEQYYAARLAVGVLSGGMSGRLFTEVREKRSLCYAVYAMHHHLKDRASILCYAGTTHQRAQETLEVTLAELRRLSQGVGPDELDRAKAGLKSALVMQGESTSARSGAIATDWFLLGRVRSLDELTRRIDAVRVEDVMDHLRSHPPGPFTILTLGPKPLEMPC